MEGIPDMSICPMKGGAANCAKRQEIHLSHKINNLPTMATVRQNWQFATWKHLCKLTGTKKEQFYHPQTPIPHILHLWKCIPIFHSPNIYTKVHQSNWLSKLFFVLKKALECLGNHKQHVGGGHGSLVNLEGESVALSRQQASSISCTECRAKCL